jgi:uncharacterized membrane protein
MIWLVVGVLMWSVVHSFRSVAAPLRARLIAGMGEDKYKGLFALAIVTSIVLMVVGWRATPPVLVYRPPSSGRILAILLMLPAFIFFAASAMATNIKRFVRHPQLTGVLLWALAHLVSNGDGRSLVLFGVLGLWALVEMPLINRREGPWQQPDPRPLTADVKPVLGGLGGYIVFFVVHPYLFGRSPMPM